MRFALIAIVAWLAATPARADFFSDLFGFGRPPVMTTARPAPWQRARHHMNWRAKPKTRAAGPRTFAKPLGSSLYDLVTAAALRHGVPVALAHAIVRAESGYRCAARSASGAQGIMQVKPGTARGVGVAGNLLDCSTGLEAGMRYLRQAVTRGGAGCVGASLYNTGIGAPPRCTGYGRQVVALSGGAS